MWFNSIRIIFAIIGSAALIRSQATGPLFELDETSLNETKEIAEAEFNSTDLKIPLLRCCHGDFRYIPFVDHCESYNPTFNETETTISDAFSEIPIQLENYLSVYSMDTNEIIELSQPLELMNGSMTDCPVGYFGNSTRDFKLFDDGSLRIGERRLEPKSFCINRIEMLDTDSVVYAARFCDPDPCKGKNCIRKCCPPGMALALETQTCEIHPVPFDGSELRDENNSSINLESYTVYSGLGIKCLELRVQVTNFYPDQFFISPDGRMNNLDYPCKAFEYDYRTTDNYCVDHVFSDNETVEVNV